MDQGIEPEENVFLSSASGEDERPNVGEVAMKTAAERRAEKRKMKRFRSVRCAICQLLFTHSVQVDPYPDQIPYE